MEENEILITQSAFAEAILFDGRIGYSDGSFQMFYFDIDIFWGHTIVVHIDSERKFDGANIAG